MPWIRMRFKDQAVWIRADDAGRPILDAGGRAEMKYREADAKSYRPALGNLMPDDAAREGGPELKELPAPRPAGRARAAGGAKPSAHEKVAGALEVWTDGACSGNPGPMGIGVVVVDHEKRRELGEYLGVGTNNIAELVAIERGLEIADEIRGGDAARRVRVYSDSGYAIGLLSQGWKAKANQDLVARIRQQLAATPNVEFVKVRGHAGVPENERCDELARQAILRRQ
jgi:ribonuclease HI